MLVFVYVICIILKSRRRYELELDISCRKRKNKREEKILGKAKKVSKSGKTLRASNTVVENKLLKEQDVDQV